MLLIGIFFNTYLKMNVIDSDVLLTRVGWALLEKYETLLLLLLLLLYKSNTASVV